MPLPAPSDLARHWMLDPQTVFLNHGSFGACPRAVLEFQDGIRREMEHEPVRFFVERLPELIDEARQAMAACLHCRDENLVFVPNATTGVATVLANLADQIEPGDELLATNWEYPACLNNLRRIAQRRSATVVMAGLPFPLASEDEVVDAVLEVVTHRTRVALISHVTAPTALILPVARLVQELEGRGIAVIIDGAHAAGMVPIDLDALGASFYTANCHKWLCAPKGAAVLHVREDRQQGAGEGFRPLVLSNQAEKPVPARKHMLTEFDYTGTQDVSSWLSIPRTLDFVAGLVEGGWVAIRERNCELALKGRDVLCRRLGISPPAPDVMIGSMCAVALPPHDAERQAQLRLRPTRYHDALQDELLARYRIQVPIWGMDGMVERYLRISAQLYNTLEQYEYLAEAVAEELSREAQL